MVFTLIGIELGNSVSVDVCAEPLKSLASPSSFKVKESYAGVHQELPGTAACPGW